MGTNKENECVDGNIFDREVTRQEIQSTGWVKDRKYNSEFRKCCAQSGLQCPAGARSRSTKVRSSAMQQGKNSMATWESSGPYFGMQSSI